MPAHTRAHMRVSYQLSQSSENEAKNQRINGVKGKNPREKQRAFGPIVIYPFVKR